MSVFEKLGVPGMDSIDWEITPELTFTMFESWGSRLWIRSLDERYYYFYIDAWKEPAKLCLMERGVKFARVIAEIDAPQDMVDACVAGQGKKIGLDKSFAINAELKKWLLENVLDAQDSSKVTPVKVGVEVEDMHTGLPALGEKSPLKAVLKLRSTPAQFVEADLPAIVQANNSYDAKLNPEGEFQGCLVDNGDGLTVTDLASGIMWQREGFDISSIRTMQKNLETINKENFAGHSDWRLPTTEEALTLMKRDLSEKEMHIHPCFSKAQPFVFLVDQRLPGGYWFADFKQGNIYWASGTNPGAFGRLCRNV